MSLFFQYVSSILTVHTSQHIQSWGAWNPPNATTFAMGLRPQKHHSESSRRRSPLPSSVANSFPGPDKTSTLDITWELRHLFSKWYNPNNQAALCSLLRFRRTMDFFRTPLDPSYSWWCCPDRGVQSDSYKPISYWLMDLLFRKGRGSTSKIHRTLGAKKPWFRYN